MRNNLNGSRVESPKVIKPNTVAFAGCLKGKNFANVLELKYYDAKLCTHTRKRVKSFAPSVD